MKLRILNLQRSSVILPTLSSNAPSFVNVIEIGGKKKLCITLTLDRHETDILGVGWREQPTLSVPRNILHPTENLIAKRTGMSNVNYRYVERPSNSDNHS